MAKYKVEVTDECIGCQACVSSAEELFEMNGDGSKAVPKKKVIDEGDLEKAEEAKEICPTEAIKVNKED
jgi:ferredoxin